MPWKGPADKAPSVVRDAAYDAYSQGVRLRVAGYSAERIRTEGLQSFLSIPPQVAAREYIALIEHAFWAGFEK